MIYVRPINRSLKKIFPRARLPLDRRIISSEVLFMIEVRPLNRSLKKFFRVQDCLSTVA